MNPPKISVIVPVYNTEEYLEQCLNSLISQTYKNLEIICVNDGSTDKSSNILENYSKLDERIKIINQENQGFTAARNRGLKEISGDWIAFLDSDDWLNIDCYQKFFESLQKAENFDVYMFNAVCFCENKNNSQSVELQELFFNKELWGGKNNEICEYKDCKNPFQGNLAVYNKIYRKDFFFGNNFKFQKGFVEDERFWIEAFVKAKRIYITDEVFYHYRQREGSVMHSVNKNVFEMFDTYNAIGDILVENKVFDIAKYAFLQFKFNQYAWGFFIIPDELREGFYAKAKADLIRELKKGYEPNIVKSLTNSKLLLGFLNLNSEGFYNTFKTNVK